MSAPAISKPAQYQIVSLVTSVDGQNRSQLANQAITRIVSSHRHPLFASANIRALEKLLGNKNQAERRSSSNSGALTRAGGGGSVLANRRR